MGQREHEQGLAVTIAGGRLNRPGHVASMGGREIVS